MASIEQYKNLIDKAWDNRNLLENAETKNAVFDVLELIDKGKLRVGEPITANGK